MTRIILARHWARKKPRLPRNVAAKIAAKKAKKPRLARKGERGHG